MNIIMNQWESVENHETHDDNINEHHDETTHYKGIKTLKPNWNPKPSITNTQNVLLTAKVAYGRNKCKQKWSADSPPNSKPWMCILQTYALNTEQPQ